MKGLAKLTWNELRLFGREPASVFFSLGFPTLLLVILGSIPGFREHVPGLGGARPIDLYVPIMVAFCMGMLAMQAVPTALATYREKGILRRMAVSPIRPINVIEAQLLMTLLLAVGAVVMLLVVGRIAYDVPFPQQLVAFMLSFVLGCAALLAVGLALAAVMPTGRAASTVGTLLFFPLMFFGGLWIPRAAMPETLRHIGDFTPLGAGVQALQDAATGNWAQPIHIVVLAAYVVVFAAIASRMFRWQ